LRVAFVLKGYPRLSEAFIAQEIAALERRGLDIVIVSLRQPTHEHRHPIHDEIRAPLHYLPEYLLREPLRVIRAWLAVRKKAGYRKARAAWLRDLRRDPTPNRIRRFGQALALAAELPADVGRLHAHFLHTPASVTRYAAMIRGLPWSGSATRRTSGPRRSGRNARSSPIAIGSSRARASTATIWRRSHPPDAWSSSITASILRASRRRHPFASVQMAATHAIR